MQFLHNEHQSISHPKCFQIYESHSTDAGPVHLKLWVNLMTFVHENGIKLIAIYIISILIAEDFIISSKMSVQKHYLINTII